MPRNRRASATRAVLFITSPDEPTCDKELTRLRAPGGDFSRLQSVGWKIGPGPENHLQIVDQSAIPELITQLNIKHYPTVACVNGERIVRLFQAGCTTPLDMWTFGWLAKGIDERAIEQPARSGAAETTGNYPLRGNHWSVDGDWSPSRETVIGHLRSPAHARYLNASQEIEKWSVRRAGSLHDNLHDIYGGGISASALRKASSNANSLQRDPARSWGISGLPQ